uniref:DUF4371 domain-containing protein n=1 Tax=Latimeria chalumnae TaxID=7897 RepID=H3ALZ6_LATCH
LFTLSTDASNKKNRKMFPVRVQYFEAKVGTRSALTDFVEQGDEFASSITDLVMDRVKKFGLQIENISAYSADNTNVNFGRKYSVYELLRNQNESILKANCLAHVVHNACRKASNRLPTDIENLALKAYSHFYQSAKLESFCNFVEVEFRDLLRHVPTRRLSLLPAIQRLLEEWPAIQSLGEEDCPKFIWDMISINANVEDNTAPLDGVVVLLFCHNVPQCFQETILLLESDILTSIELHGVMNNLVSWLK